MAEEPQCSRLAARLLATTIAKEVAGQGVGSFSTSVRLGQLNGLIADATAALVAANAAELDAAVQPGRDGDFEYFGLRTVYDRYLLRHPLTRAVIETPQSFFLRVGCGLAESPADAIELYELMSRFAYLPSSPTLFNSGTGRTQLSSCFLLDSPRDDLEAIYQRYSEVAKLSNRSSPAGSASACRGCGRGGR
jgi:ribonucleoside-diphosphate reductase alpha chain